MYEQLSAYYDMFMDGVDRAGWAKYLARFIPPGAKRGLDIGCGTGGITLELLGLGYDVIGMDPSEEMLAEAAKNAARAGIRGARFVRGKCETFSLPRPVSFITACCDVVNYLADPLKFFRRAHEALEPGGVLLFDISSESKLRGTLSGRTFTDERNGTVYIWENGEAESGFIDMKLTFFAPGPEGLYTRSEDEQRQYIHETDKIEKELYDAGFATAERYEFGSTKLPAETAERIQFIAQKEERRE